MCGLKVLCATIVFAAEKLCSFKETLYTVKSNIVKGLVNTKKPRLFKASLAPAVTFFSKYQLLQSKID